MIVSEASVQDGEARMRDDGPMVRGIDIASVAALIGDVARANILSALMDGRARTASELAYCAGVSAPTTSSHLAKLTDAKLLAVEAQGRHRYYRLVSPTVGQAIEALTLVAAEAPKPHRRPGPRDEAMRAARTCYDHLAGRLGVGLTDAMVEQGVLSPEGQEFRLTPGGAGFLAEIGVEARPARDGGGAGGGRRAFCRSCLDWSERRPHAAGALGAALAARSFAAGWIERMPETRAVRITSAGKEVFREAFGFDTDGGAADPQG